MVSLSHSQNILEEDRVRTLVNKEGDTLIVMSYEDAKILLNDVLEYEYTNSLLVEYKKKDTLNLKTITLQKEIIDALNEKYENSSLVIENLDKMLANKDEEIALINDTIKQQSKEIKRQKRMKIFGFATVAILPITFLLIK